MDWIPFLMVYFRLIVHAKSTLVNVLQLESNTVHDTLKNINKIFLSFPVWKLHFSDAKSSDKQE